MGCSRGSDTLFWDTSVADDPDEWTVVVTHQGPVPGSGLLAWHRYDLTLTGISVTPSAAAGNSPPHRDR
ncbi:hypothetical protein ACF07Y_41050 [Streptomyces sp. NPDC016566]|uniref:hypothetical protein n=1 Tax=Streptomyces sp. NPDC016566 TaxID=3364967 RepID=UPI0036F9CAC5